MEEVVVAPPRAEAEEEEAVGVAQRKREEWLLLWLLQAEGLWGGDMTAALRVRLWADMRGEWRWWNRGAERTDMESECALPTVRLEALGLRRMRLHSGSRAGSAESWQDCRQAWSA